MEYKAAIFDLDGTLAESNSVWEKLDRVILERRGLSCSDEFIRKLTAMTYEDAAEELKKIGLEISTEKLMSELNELAIYEYSNNIQLKDGAMEYFDYLKAGGKKICLATASPAYLYEPVLKHNGIYDYFDSFTTTEEVGKSKDYPDVYLKAAEKADVLPEQCVVFEDVLKGIKSASAVGMIPIGVYDKYSENDMDKIKEYAAKYIFSFDEMIEK